MFYKLIRPLLFLLPPETAHFVTLNLLRFSPGFLAKKIDDRPCQVMGLIFPNRIGLAAGFDNNGDYIDALAKLGFGFLEVGGVTPHAQMGNTKPRLFRLIDQEALINRMGFANKGVDYLVERLKSMRYRGIIGVNIAKSLDTPLENAFADYQYCITKVYPYVSYITVNVSSPNTPGLRELQRGERFDTLLSQLKNLQLKLQQQQQRYVPLVIKISPDEDPSTLKNMAASLLRHAIDGVIATNTTLSRESLQHPLVKEKGGLSGKPLSARATTVVTQLHHELGGKIPIIALGGIMTASDAAEKFAAGASLIQIYTGLIYAGPSLIAKASLVG